MLEKKLSGQSSPVGKATISTVDGAPPKTIDTNQSNQLKRLKTLVINQVKNFRKSNASQTYEVQEAVDLIKDGIREMISEEDLEQVRAIIVDEHLEPSLLEHGLY